MRPGDRLGPYEIVALLGAGGMGEVYRARDTRLGRDVAIKVLPAEFATEPERLKRFEREARATAALSHPNILDVHDVGTHEGVGYLVEELLEGESLKAQIGRGPIPVREAVGIAVQIAHGLAAAHAKNIVHRDLKPANVFLTTEGTVKILDFGLAKLVQSVPLEEADTLTHAPTAATEAGRVLGTVAYMAPEQARGMPVDQRADVFAFGVVLYEMLSGERPFRGETATDTVAAIIKDEPVPLPASVAAPLAGLVERCLEKEPAQRYQRGSEVEAALEAVRGGCTVSLPVFLKQSIRRRLWLVGANAIAGLLVLALILDVGGVRKRLLGGASAGRIDSLAVLPLENLSGNPEQEYLAAGMHDALVTNLGQLAGLKRVIARGSVMRFKGTSEAPKEIARELGVSGLITGAVLRSGDRVRVTAQLIDPATQAQVWAHSYEASLRDVLSLENEIVAAITREIKVQLTPQEETRLATTRPVDPEAYEACLKGKFHELKQTREDADVAERYYRFALEKDPNYAPAYVGLGSVNMMRADAGFTAPGETFPKAVAFLKKAESIDDSSAEVHVWLGNLDAGINWDWTGAEREFKRALELNPQDSDAHFFNADLLICTKRDDEWQPEIRRALELDPLNEFKQSFYGWHLNYLRRYEEAIPIFQRLLPTGPNKASNYLGLWGAFYEQKKFADAIAAAKSYFTAIEEQQFADALVTGGGEAAYRAAMRRTGKLMAEESTRRHVPAIRIARMFAHAGDKDAAMEWLEKAYKAGESPLMRLAVFWDWDNLRSDPRFRDLLRRMKLPLQ